MKKKTKTAKASKKAKAKSKKAVPDVPVSNTGWKVLTALWKQGPCKASEIEKSLGHKIGWSRSVVRSFLSRLIKYGLVRRYDDEKIARFEAVYDRDTLFFREIEALLEKCDADFGELAAVYLANKRLSAKTAKSLKNHLAKHKPKK